MKHPVTRGSFMRVFALAIALGASGHAQTPSPTTSDYVRSPLLWSRLQYAVKALGDRLEKPGKERLTLQGAVARATGSTQIRSIWELPGKFRFEEQIAGVTRVVAFDGATAWTSSGALLPADLDLLETFVNDSAEQFFVGQMRGLATRFLGERYRMDDGRTPNYTGPFYDIYSVDDRVTAGRLLSRPKFYYFNSDTGLCERVRYEVQGLAGRTRIEVRSSWRNQDGQQVPSSITRAENGQAVLTFSFSSATLSARTDDGIFRPLTTGDIVKSQERRNADQ